MAGPQKDIWVVFGAFVAVLGCFTTVAIIGSDGFGTLENVLLTLAGALSATAIASRHNDTPPK